MPPFLIIASFSIATLLGGDAAAQTVPRDMPAFAAEVETIYKLADGTESRSKGNLYRSRSGQIREDSPVGAVITDVAAGTITILVTQTKEARVITIPPEERALPARSSRPAPEVVEESWVRGRPVSKARAQGSHGQKVELWTAKDLGVVIWSKMETTGLTRTKELRNISTEEPSPSLFAIPADYTVIHQEARRGSGPQRGVPSRPGPVPPAVRQGPISPSVR